MQVEQTALMQREEQLRVRIRSLQVALQALPPEQKPSLTGKKEEKQNDENDENIEDNSGARRRTKSEDALSVSHSVWDMH